jgi:hypothetical protein
LSAERSCSENLPHFDRILLRTICLVAAAAVFAVGEPEAALAMK